jgi:glycosyltransferase involved in cell wall biosynthesis
MLHSVRSQQVGEPTEIVLVDNGCGPDFAARVAAVDGPLPVRIVEAHRRANASYARNAGVAAARGRKLLFLDADDELAGGYVAAMTAALDSHRFVAARVDSVSLNPEWVRRAHGDPWDGVGVYFGFLPATGVNIGIDRELFQQVGGFPEDFPASQDIVFSWDVHLAGVPAQLVQDALYRYRYRDSLPGLYRQCRAWGYSNVMLYCRFREAGMPGRSLRDGLREWRGALSQAASARGWSDLAVAAARIGYCVGRFRGSVRHRVRYF